MANDYCVNEAVVTWCAVTKDGLVLGKDSGVEACHIIRPMYHITCLDWLLYHGGLTLCRTRRAAEDVCRKWNECRSRNDRYWATPKKIAFRMMEVCDGE